MARLADDWEDQRQTCIDVLCAYLRLPYDPADPSKHREGDREARRTTIRIIRDHLRSTSPVPWSGYNFSFEGARYQDGDVTFDGATVSGCRLRWGPFAAAGASLGSSANRPWRALRRLPRLWPARW